MEKQGYHHGDLKAELIQKGIEILNDEGYEGFSLRKVAKACGVSQTAPYRHFKDKNAMASEIVNHALGKFNESLAAAVNKHPDNTGDQIKEMGVAYVQFFIENPQYLHLLFLSDTRMVPAEVLCGAENHNQEGHPFTTFISAVQRYKDSSPGDKRDFGELLITWWGLVHGIAVLAVRGEIPDGYNVSEIISRIIWSGQLF